MAIAAGIVGNLMVATGLTALDVAAKGGGARCADGFV
jgi:hypothetical protein